MRFSVPSQSPLGRSGVDLACGASVRYLLAAVASLLLVGVGCSGRAKGQAVRAIPGTEQVAIDDFSISLSPDEGWLAFTEWTLPKDRVFKDLPPTEYESRVATLNLESGVIVRHELTSIPAEKLGFYASEQGWVGVAGLEVIRQRFRPAGWRGSRFYFQAYFQGTHVAFDPQVPGLFVVDKPDAPGACSDFPPVPSFTFRGQAWDLRSNEVTAAFADGAIQSVYYVGGSPHRMHLILRLGMRGDEEVIVEKEKRDGTLMTIECVRVSPDTQYLAYVLYSKRMAFLSGPRNELFVKELATGREKRIAKHGYMSNVAWSPDGERLYFAGGGYSSDAAVRVADIAATFSE